MAGPTSRSSTARGLEQLGRDRWLEEGLRNDEQADNELSEKESCELLDDVRRLQEALQQAR
jgi:hypothetical protein